MQPGQLTHVHAPSVGLPSSSRAPRGGIGGHSVLGQAEPRPAAPRCPSLNSELDHTTSALVLGSLQSPCTEAHTQPGQGRADHAWARHQDSPLPLSPVCWGRAACEGDSAALRVTDRHALHWVWRFCCDLPRGAEVEARDRQVPQHSLTSGPPNRLTTPDGSGPLGRKARGPLKRQM